MRGLDMKMAMLILCCALAIIAAPAQTAKEQAAKCRAFIEQSKPVLPYIVAAKTGCKASDVVLSDVVCGGENELVVTAKTKIKGKARGVFGNVVYKGGNRNDPKSWDTSGMIVTK